MPKRKPSLSLLDELNLEKERVAKQTVDRNCCEICGRELSEQRANLSLSLTYELGGPDPQVLCKKDYDKWQREKKRRDSDW